MESTVMFIDYMDTPIGVIEIQASSQGITRVDFSVLRNDAINKIGRAQV